MSAIKMFRRIIRHQCYDFIYQKKLTERKSFEFFQVEDEDLFIDLKLNYQNDKERELALLFNKPKPKETKGKEFDTMPFFLSDEFKSIMDEKNRMRQLQENQDKLLNSGTMGGISTIGSIGGGSSLYKSEFIRERLLE